jgi:4-hydroxy-L-threonine phosphate dehydrogenase PdxA
MSASIQANGNRCPRIGITMGDPAGIGPEIIVKALAHKQIYESARPLVIGDATRLKTAAKIVSSPVKIRALTDPANANCELGLIECVDLGLRAWMTYPSVGYRRSPAKPPFALWKRLQHSL